VPARGHRLEEIAMHTARFDIYALIHKGLRACFADTLVAVGRLDWTDNDDVDEASRAVQELLDFCAKHLDKENRFVHPAMESRRPGSAALAQGDHAHHERDIAALRELALTLRLLPALRREAAARELYQRLTAFITENLEHMAMEEREHNRVLWETHSDEELLAIEGAIVASMPPEDAQLSLRWMMGAMAAEERARFLSALRERAPAPVFDGMLQMIRPLLCERDRFKLDRALGLPRVAADYVGL
jgi:hypothetical protein